MDPASIAAAVVGLIDWKALGKKLVQDSVVLGVKSGRDSLLGRLKPTEREKLAHDAITLFTQEFVQELDDRNPLTAALEGYQQDIKLLLEAAALDIAAWLQPETKMVDLGSVERMWLGLSLHPLPEGFKWTLVAENYARALRLYVKHNPTLRAELEVAIAEDSRDFAQRFNPGFDLEGYRDFLNKKCGTLQLSPLHASTYDRRVGLWSVFVPQSARESAPVRDISRELVRRLRKEGHIPSEHNEPEIQRLREAYASAAPGPVLDILERQRLLVLLGDPGSGKTSLLKYTVLRWVKDNQGPMPLWIDLKEYARHSKGILQYLESEECFGLEARSVNEHLRASTAALYLDGLDEIFDHQMRATVIEQIAAFTGRYPQTRTVVTSRIIGYEPERLSNAGFVHATLEEFTDPQIAQFLEKWHNVCEDDPKERARLVDHLQRAFRESSAIRELAGNPLLLTMMAILNRNQELPRDRVELYREASRVLLHEWDASRSLPADLFGRQEKEALLRELAGTMQQREGGLAGNLIEHESLLGYIRVYFKSIGIDGAYEKAVQLVHQLTERNFILCYAGAGQFSFVHRTFLEYFCAAYFVRQFERDHTLSIEQLKTEVYGLHWKDETWHEVLRLIAGMIGEKQAEKIIQFLLEQEGRSDKLNNIILAAGCLSEVRNRRSITETDQLLREVMIRKAIRYDLPYFHEEYDEDDEVEATRVKAVALIASVWRSEAQAWLSLAVRQDTDQAVRRAAIQELASGWKDNPATLQTIRDSARLDEDWWVRNTALQEITGRWKDDSDTLPFVKNCLSPDEDSEVRSAAVKELARGWNEDPDTLSIVKTRARSDQDVNVRNIATKELVRGWKDHADMLPMLKDRVTSDEEPYLRREALQEIARGWKDDLETLPMLRSLSRSDEEAFVRISAVQELARGWKGDSEVLVTLKDCALLDEDSDVRCAALQEIARNWKEDQGTLPMLKDCTRSEKDLDVRDRAVRELARGWSGDANVLILLKNCADSAESPDLQSSAVQAVIEGWKDDPGTLPWLIDSLEMHSSMRSTVVRELARGWKSVPDILTMLRERARSDWEPEVRSVALRELARGWNTDPNMLPMLKESVSLQGDADLRL